MHTQQAQFFIGQCIHHRMFDYRGVIVDVDPEFQGTDDWYEQVARSRPPRDEPWYRVLVHGTDQETYVAQRNLEPDPGHGPVQHPLVDEFFRGFQDGVYLPHRGFN